MSERRDFETRLAEAVKVYATDADRDFDPSALAHAVMESSERRRLWRPVVRQPLALDTGLRIALALLLLATLLVSMAVAGSRLLEPRLVEVGPTPTPTPTPTLSPTPVVADGADEVISVETSIGGWTWTRYDGDPATLAEIRLRESAAGRADAPAGPATFPAPACAGIPFPEIESLEWHHHCPSEQVASDGTTTVAAVSIGATYDWTSLFGANVEPAYVDAEARRLEMGDVRLAAVLDLETEPAAIEFWEQGGEAPALRLEATDPAITARQLAGATPGYWGWEVEIWLLHVDDGEGAWLEPPWQGMTLSAVDVASADGQFWAVAASEPAWFEEPGPTVLHTWSSPDGITWQELGQPISLPGNMSALELEGDGDQLLMVLDTGSGPGQTFLRETKDGGEWHALDAGIRSPGRLARTGFGWAYVSNGAEACDVWVSSDGLEWEQIEAAPVLEDPEWDGPMSASCVLVGDVVLALREYETSGSFWVGRFGE